jgi:multidrug efflux pump subunit AcrB
MRIRKDDGTAVPFSLVANTEYSESLASIERYDNKRVVAVEGSIDKAVTSSDDIQTRLQNEY